MELEIQNRKNKKEPLNLGVFFPQSRKLILNDFLMKLAGHGLVFDADKVIMFTVWVNCNVVVEL